MKHILPLLASLLLTPCSSPSAAESNSSISPSLGVSTNVIKAQGELKKLVLLDNFFHRQTKDGKRYHYTWDDTAGTGYSKLGDLFIENGARVEHLTEAPTAEDLRQCSVYIIVNPDNERTSSDHKPNYMTTATAEIIRNWVKSGGVLMLMNNDKGNVDFEHINILAGKFGIIFNEDCRNAAPHHEPEKMQLDTRSFVDHPILQGVSLVSMRGICTLSLQEPAKAILTAPKESGQGTNIIMATSSLGGGRVFALGDPWLYNEYIHTADNYKAAENLVRWLLGESADVKKPSSTSPSS